MAASIWTPAIAFLHLYWQGGSERVVMSSRDPSMLQEETETHVMSEQSPLLVVRGLVRSEQSPMLVEWGLRSSRPSLC